MIRGLLAVVVLGLGVFVVDGSVRPSIVSAAPLDALSQKRVNAVKQHLSRVEIDASLRKNVPLSRAKEVEKAAHDASGRVTAARREFKKIPARNKKHPDVIALDKQIQLAEAYVADLQAVLAQHRQAAQQKNAAEEQKRRDEAAREQAEAKRQQEAEAALRSQHEAAMSAFSKEYWKYKEDLEWFKPFASDPSYTLNYGDSTIAEGKAMFADIHRGCTGKHKDIADPAKLWNANYRWWCELAAQGDVVLRRMVENWIRQRASLFATAFKKQEAELATCDGRLKHMDWTYYDDPKKVKSEWLARYGADAKAVGMHLSDDIFAEADAALASLLPKIEEASKGWKFSPYGKPANDAWVKKTYQKALKGVKVKKIYLTDKQWRVYKNSLGVNLHRTKRGTILLQNKGEPWCHSDTFTIVQDAKGRKGFGKSYFEHAVAGHGRIVRCE